MRVENSVSYRKENKTVIYDEMHRTHPMSGVFCVGNESGGSQCTGVVFQSVTEKRKGVFI